MYRGYSSIALQELFEMDTNSKGTRGHSCKLKKVRCTRDIVQYFFSNRVINRWNALDQNAVDAPSINAFKQILVKIRNKTGKVLRNVKKNTNCGRNGRRVQMIMSK